MLACALASAPSLCPFQAQDGCLHDPRGVCSAAVGCVCLWLVPELERESLNPIRPVVCVEAYLGEEAEVKMKRQDENCHRPGPASQRAARRSSSATGHQIGRSGFSGLQRSKLAQCSGVVPPTWAIFAAVCGEMTAYFKQLL